MEGPEGGAGGAKRQGGLGRGAVAPPQYEVWGYAPRKLKKINDDIAYFL